MIDLGIGRETAKESKIERDRHQIIVKERGERGRERERGRESDGGRGREGEWGEG